MNYAREINPRGRALKTVGYQAMGCVVGRHADLDTVADHHLYPVFLHSTGKDASNCHVVVALNFHGTAAEYSLYNAF